MQSLRLMRHQQSPEPTIWNELNLFLKFSRVIPVSFCLWRSRKKWFCSVLAYLRIVLHLHGLHSLGHCWSPRPKWNWKCKICSLLCCGGKLQIQCFIKSILIFFNNTCRLIYHIWPSGKLEIRKAYLNSETVKTKNCKSVSQKYVM